MYSFQLSDGVCWYLTAADSSAATAVDGLAAAMRLPRVSSDRSHGDPERVVRVFRAPPEGPQEGVFCVLPREELAGSKTFGEYATICHALARGLLLEGGVLLHGALAEYLPEDGAARGVVFSARGGVGKSTVSRRLPAPWRPLSDDAVLAMPDGQGRYFAHPWPTLSFFLEEDRSGKGWDVQASVPLRACVFLKQALQDSIEPLGAGKAASLLAESARQINFLDSKLPAGERRSVRLRRFEAVCRLARTVPAHVMHFSLKGEFWREVEQVLK